MPASAAWARPEDLVESLSSLDNTARLKALRDVKNQIIGNKTKKLSYIKLGAVPRVVEILVSDTEIPLLVQSAAALGSFACGIDAGVRAVLDSGVLPHLLKMLQNGDSKVLSSFDLSALCYPFECWCRHFSFQFVSDMGLQIPCMHWKARYYFPSRKGFHSWNWFLRVLYESVVGFVS